MDMITIYIAVWMLWVMIYFAHRYYPIVMAQDRKASEIRDEAFCHKILENDDILGPEDEPLFMNILYTLDFLYYTCLLAAATCGIICFAKNIIKELNI